jgi:hypothetical protein
MRSSSLQSESFLNSSKFYTLPTALPPLFRSFCVSGQTIPPLSTLVFRHLLKINGSQIYFNHTCFCSTCSNFHSAREYVHSGRVLVQLDCVQINSSGFFFSSSRFHICSNRIHVDSNHSHFYKVASALSVTGNAQLEIKTPQSGIFRPVR